MSIYYGMGGEPIDSDRWARLLKDTAGRILGRDEIGLPGGGTALVSTVWLGLDHRFHGDGPPLIFETMIFWQSGDYGSEDYCVRTATREAALAAHDQAVQHARTLGGVVLEPIDRADG